MKNIRRFHTYEDYLHYLNNPDSDYNSLDTKMIYIEDQERMILGSATKDIVIEMADFNSDMLGLKSYIVTTNQINTSITLIATRFNEGYFGALGTITCGQQYSINTDELRVLMWHSGAYKELSLDTHFVFDEETGLLSLTERAPITGNVQIIATATRNDELHDNAIQLYITGKNYDSVDITSIDNIELLAGETYEFTVITTAGQTFGSINTVSAHLYDTQYADITMTLDTCKLHVYGNNGVGGLVTISFVAPISNGYAATSLSKTFNVNLQTPDILNWENVFGENDYVITSEGYYAVSAGITLDLSVLRTTGDCVTNITTELSNSVVANIGDANFTRKYELVGNGTGGYITYTINIVGNNNFVAATKKYIVQVNLIPNTIEWDFEDTSATLNWEAGKFYTCNINAAYNADYVTYYSNKTANTTIQGNSVLFNLTGKNETFTLTAKIPASENYAEAKITKTINVSLCEPTVVWSMNNVTEIISGNKFNCNSISANSSANPTFTILKNRNITINNPETGNDETYKTTNTTYDIQLQSGELTINSNDNKLPDSILVIEAKLAAAGNYKGWTDYRVVVVKLIENTITWSTGTVLYVNQENDKYVMPAYKTSNNIVDSITCYYSNADGDKLSEYTNFTYVPNGDKLEIGIKPAEEMKGQYILVEVTVYAAKNYATNTATRLYVCASI